MTFIQLWKILLKRWNIVLLCIMMVGLGTYVVSRLMTPLYQSSVLVQIAIQSGTSQADYNSLLASNQLVQTESDLAISLPVLREVASHYPGMTVDLLAKETTSSIKLSTQLQHDLRHSPTI
jgi:tyrosine-protein kinase